MLRVRTIKFVIKTTNKIRWLNYLVKFFKSCTSQTFQFVGLNCLMHFRHNAKNVKKIRLKVTKMFYEMTSIINIEFEISNLETTSIDIILKIYSSIRY